MATPTYKTGSETVITVGVSDTWGTAADMSNANKIVVDGFDQSTNPEELSETGIGSGGFAKSDAQQGAIAPTVTGSRTMRYDDAGLKIIGVHFQGESVMSMGNGAYCHSFMHSNFNQFFLSQAKQFMVGSVMEFATAAVTRLRRVFDTIPGYSKLEWDSSADARTLSGGVNDYDALAGATVDGSNNKIIFKDTDDFWINVQSHGAVSSSNRLNIVSLEWESNKPQDAVREAKGAAGLGEPIATGDPVLTGTVRVVCKALDNSNYTYLFGSQLGTEYKAQYNVTGDLIGGSNYYKEVGCFPRLKLISDPVDPESTGAVNQFELTFEILEADSAPTGMWDTTPYLMITTTQSGAFLTDES